MDRTSAIAQPQAKITMKIPVADLTEDREPVAKPLGDDDLYLKVIGFDDVRMSGLVDIARSVSEELFSPSMVHSALVKPALAHVLPELLEQSYALSSPSAHVLFELQQLKNRVAALEQQVSRNEQAIKPEQVAAWICDLSKAFDLSNAAALLQHIVAMPQIVTPLTEASLELRKRFGNEVPLQLRDEDGQLTIGIGTALGVPQAEELLSRFINEWWLVNEKIEGPVVVTLDWI